MSKWKTVRLGDMCEIQSGGTPSRSKIEYWKNGNIPWVKIGDFSGKYLEKTSEFITQQGLDNSSAKLFSKGTILYSIFATLGEVSILNIDATTNQAIAGIKLRNESEINIDFFYLYLKSLKDEVNRIGRGVAQNNINLSILKNFIIPLPPLETQKQIAAVLDKCTSLISKYKKMLEKYDTLIKSRFIEMFGDIQQYEKLSSFSTLITKGASPRWQGIEYTDEGTLFITSENVRERFIDYSKKKFLPANINDILPRSILKKNDVLINIVGASIGRAAIFDSDLLANINQAVALVRLDFNKIDELFLVTYLNSENALKMYSEMKKGGARDNLSLQNISDLKIPICDLKSQKRFATFVQQIDKSKFAIQKSLEKAETLYKSLMQEYFG